MPATMTTRHQSAVLSFVGLPMVPEGAGCGGRWAPGGGGG